MRFIYGDIVGLITEDISQVKLIKYLMGKNSQWNEFIFQTIHWNSVGCCMKKMSQQRVTNLLKMVHGWENNGQKKDLFYENNEDYWCPAGCGQTEQNSILCNAQLQVCEKDT